MLTTPKRSYFHIRSHFEVLRLRFQIVILGCCSSNYTSEAWTYLQFENGGKVDQNINFGVK
jgi:hypothetical protein